jgi:hypothetical protein
MTNFNLPDMDWHQFSASSSTMYNIFIKLIDEFDSEFTCKLTMMSDTGKGHLPDHVTINIQDSISNTKGQNPLSISDHCIIQFHVETPVTKHC